jgi:phage-related protein
MPDSVQAVAPATVMPYSLAVAFQQSRSYATDQNRYPDGSLQTRAIANASRKSWTMSRRATASQLAALRAFYIARQGPAQAFWFYDVYETSPQFSYDATGMATVGRYAVRFDGRFEQHLDWGRNPVQIALVEVS